MDRSKCREVATPRKRERGRDIEIERETQRGIAWLSQAVVCNTSHWTLHHAIIVVVFAGSALVVVADAWWGVEEIDAW